LVWKFRKSAFIISAELHQKIVQSCAQVDQVPSEILGLRKIGSSHARKSKKKQFGASNEASADSTHKIVAVAGG
jgi:hypothetical protein